MDYELKWKPIKGFEGLYDLRNDGLIYVHPRKHCKGGYTYGNKNPLGYMTKTLSNGKLKKLVLLHKLVWETFVGSIPNGFDVHHINHNKSDNRVINLKLITEKEHTELHNKDRIKKRIKTVLQYTLDNEFVAEYESSAEAKRQTNINSSHINAVCNGKRKTAGGYIWKFN